MDSPTGKGREGGCGSLPNHPFSGVKNVKNFWGCTPWSKYMAQSPKGRLMQGLYKPIHGNCAIYFYPGVSIWTHWNPGRASQLR